MAPSLQYVLAFIAVVGLVQAGEGSKGHLERPHPHGDKRAAFYYLVRCAKKLPRDCHKLKADYDGCDGDGDADLLADISVSGRGTYMQGVAKHGSAETWEALLPYCSPGRCQAHSPPVWGD